MAVARSSFGSVAIRYVLPVLWMTSRLAVLGRMAMSGVAIPPDVYECLVNYLLLFSKRAGLRFVMPTTNEY